MNSAHRAILSALMVAVLALAGWFPASAEIVSFDEDFTSWEFRDPSLTTANWDTLTGVLGLFPVGLDSLGSFNTQGITYATAPVDTLLFVGTDSNDALISYGIGNPAQAQSLDILATADGVRGVHIGGNFAYLCLGSTGLQSVDISDPQNLAAAGSLDLDGFAYNMASQGNRLYVAQSDFGIAVVNIASPATPILVTNTPTNNWARDVAISGNALLVADNSSGLTILDISSPDNPQLLSNLPTSGLCFGVSAQPGRAYLAAMAGGLVIVDISDPSDPVQLGSLTFPANCRSVSAVGDTVFAAVGDAGMYVVDVSDPAQPVVIGSHDTPGTAYQVSFANAVAWLADGAGGLQAFELNPLSLNEELNTAVSRNLLTGSEPVTRARLTATVSDSVSFDVSVDGGANWYRTWPDSGWVEFVDPGEDLRWRAVLVQTDAEGPPSMEQLHLEYEKLHGYGTIASVQDVPDDTGGQVRVIWSPSRFDTPGSPETVTEYSVYRRFDQFGLKDNLPDPAYPPGQWDYLTSIPADMESQYSAVVPTLADSTINGGMEWSVFFVRARTSIPGAFYDSPPDSGYSLNNLQPPPPTGFQVDRSPAEGNFLSWDAPGFSDFAHFRIYRSSSSDILPQPGNLFQVTTETEYLDTEPGLWHYLLTVVNLAGQESEPASGFSPALAGGPLLVLHPNAPNPFNPMTWIRFQIPPGGARIQLDVYDARGYRVRSLARGYFGAGDHRLSFNGKDDRGQDLASGVYYARMKSGPRVRVVKMLLVR